MKNYPLDLINEFPSPVTIKSINKKYSGYDSFADRVMSMLIVDGNNKLHYLEYTEYNLNLFFNYENGDVIR